MTDQAALQQKIPGKWLFLFYCWAVIFTDLVPRAGAIDVMGAQWLCLAVLNFVFVGLFYVSGSPAKRGTNPAIALFGIFLLFGIASTVTAINRVEATVVLSRYIIVFFTILLLYQLADLTDKNVRRYIGWAIAAVCLVESTEVMGLLYVKARSAGFHNVNLHNLTLSSFTFTQGNKNIAASNLAQKMPFLLLLVFDEKVCSKIIGFSALMLSAVAIFILGAISGIAGFALFVLLLNVSLLVYAIQTRKYLLHVAVFDAAIVLLFLFTHLFLGKMASGNSHNYSSLIVRLAGKAANNFESDGRKLMLAQGYRYLQDHPFSGCGVGNWKIAAISFDRYAFDDLRIAKHVHNDFIEMAAETGIGGGGAYVALFIFMVYALAKYAVKQRPEPGQPFNPIALILLSSLGIYIIDALFNFPAERPCSQVNLALIIAFTASLPARKLMIRNNIPRNLALAVAMLLLLPAVYSTAMVYRSMRYQQYFKDDMWLPHPQLTPAQVNAGLPAYPNLTEYAVPVNCIKARYYLVSNNGDEALRMLRSAKDANPSMGLTAGLLAECYAAKNNVDASFPYAQRAIAAMPRCRLYARVFLYNCLAKKDSTAITGYFTDLIAHSTMFYLPADWEKYCMLYYQCTGNGKKVLTLLDSALVTCPGNPRLLAYQRRIQEETELKAQSLTPGSMAIYHGLLNEAKKDYLDLDYTGAIKCFKKAAMLAPTDYSNYENLGLICFQQKDFTQSIVWFKKAIDEGKSQNGKPEYYCASSFYSIGNQAEACKYAAMAAEKKYPGAEELKNTCCRK